MEKRRIECDGDGWRFAFRSDFPLRYKMGNSIHHDHISILVGSLAVALHRAAGFKSSTQTQVYDRGCIVVARFNANKIISRPHLLTGAGVGDY